MPVPVQKTDETRSPEAWLALLKDWMGEAYAKGHPGRLEKLAALLAGHPGDPEWEAGVAAYLLKEVPKGEQLGWLAHAAASLPANAPLGDLWLRSAFGAQLPPEELQEVLSAQRARFPKDAAPLLLQAGLASGAGRDAEATSLLEEALSPERGYRELSGVAEWGGLRVRERMDGAAGPMGCIETVGETSGRLLPVLGCLGRIRQGVARQSELLLAQGDLPGHKAILDRLDLAGERIEGGSRTLVTCMVGTSLRWKSMKALQDQARGSGDLVLQEDLARRLAALESESTLLRTWNMQRIADFERPFQRLGGSEAAEDREAVPLLPDEEAILDKVCREASDEMGLFRAWKAAREKK